MRKGMLSITVLSTGKTRGEESTADRRKRNRAVAVGRRGGGGVVCVCVRGGDGAVNLGFQRQ